MNSPLAVEAFRTDYSARSGPSATSAKSPARGADAWRSGDNFRAELVTLIPQLRAFARRLGGDIDSAEDVTQETLAKAWRYQHAFRPGTNLRAWLFTICRNEYYSSRRRVWREEPFDQAAAESLPSTADQIWSTELSDTLRAVRSLPDTLRQALLLVGADGCSYEEAASICDCPVGTAKSRVSRARRALAAILDSPPSGDDAQRLQVSPA